MASTSLAYANSGTITLATTTLMLFAVHMAEFRHLDTPVFLATLQCESGFQFDAIGDHNTSFGVAQFHNPETNWGMTREQALDPYYAIARMAEEWDTKEHGGASNWSCYKNITRARSFSNLALQ